MVTTMNTTVVFDFGNVLAHIRRRAMGEALAAHSPFDAEQVLSRFRTPSIRTDVIYSIPSSVFWSSLPT